MKNKGNEATGNASNEKAESESTPNFKVAKGSNTSKQKI
jgi:hypothetical protein